MEDFSDEYMLEGKLMEELYQQAIATKQQIGNAQQGISAIVASLQLPIGDDADFNKQTLEQLATLQQQVNTAYANWEQAIANGMAKMPKDAQEEIRNYPAASQYARAVLNMLAPDAEETCPFIVEEEEV